MFNDLILTIAVLVFLLVCSVLGTCWLLFKSKR